LPVVDISLVRVSYKTILFFLQQQTIYFASSGSNLRIQNSCILAGNNQGTIYISEESNYTAETNYIDSLFATSVCQEAGLRLIQELPGSGCFDVNRTDCEFNCTSFVEVDTCMLRLETFAPSIAPINDTQAPTATFQPTITTPTPSSINMTFEPSRQPDLSTTQPIVVPMPIPTSVPIVLPPSFTATSSPIAAILPTIQPSLTPTHLPRPSLRPTPKTQPTSLETQLPTSTIYPSSSNPLCDCHSGKGKKSKKKGKGKGMGKGKGKGGDRNDDSNDDWDIAQFLSDDDHVDSYHRGTAYYGDDTDDNNYTPATQNDKDCFCRESRKGKGKSKKGKDGYGKGKKKGKGHTDSSYYNHNALKIHEPKSQKSELLQFLERNDNER
jgi:hypothetical protein